MYRKLLKKKKQKSYLDICKRVVRQRHLLKLEKEALGLKCKYICRKLHESLGT